MAKICGLMKILDIILFLIHNLLNIITILVLTYSILKIYWKGKPETTKWGFKVESFRKFELKKDGESIEELPIQMPKVCIICAEDPVEGYFDFKIRREESIKIPLCSLHYNLSKNFRVIKDKFDIFLISFIGPTFVIGFFFFQFIFYIFLSILFMYVAKKIYQYGGYRITMHMIPQYIKFRFLLNTIEIRIKNKKFASKFKELNILQEIPSNSKKLNNVVKKGVKSVALLIAWMLLGLPILLILNYFNSTLAIIVYMILFLILIVIIIYYAYKGDIETAKV